jgi:hypothetical protein
MPQTIPNIPVDDTAWVDINTAAGIDGVNAMIYANGVQVAITSSGHPYYDLSKSGAA